MKRVLVLLIVLLNTIMVSIAQKPFYVYLNDGTFKAFLTSQVDSMSVSKVDDDGIEHPDFVMQEFWTPDSLYRIPIAMIDSIGFTTPDTQFQSDAINVAETLEQYVISADTTHIYLQLSTPKHLIPTVGQKLGYPTMDKLFPYGFAGKVETVTTRSSDIEVSCKQVRLDEVFETFYCTVVSENKDDSHAKGRDMQNSFFEKVIKVPTIHIAFEREDVGCEISKNLKEDGNLALNFGTSASVELDNTFDVTMFIVVRKNFKTSIQISSVGHHDLITKASLSGGISYGDDKMNEKMGIKEPVGYGVFIYAAPGWFYEAAATLSLQSEFVQHFVSDVSFEYDLIWRQVLNPYVKIMPNGCDSNVTTCIDGTFAVGLFGEAGFTFVDQVVDKVGYHFEIGAELEGMCVLWSSDLANTEVSTGLYQKIRKSNITLSPYIAHSVVASLGPWDFEHKLGKLTFSPIWKRALVPAFSDTYVDENTLYECSAYVTSQVSDSCLNPVAVGYKLFNKDNVEVDKYVSPDKYVCQPSVLEYQFENLNQGSTYTVYPMVNIFGHDLLAVPEKEFKVPVAPDKMQPYALTGDYSNITINTATVYGFYENVSNNGVCGIEYSHNGETKVVKTGAVNGLHKFCLTELMPGTAYAYRAFVNSDGQTYYGELKWFTTDYLNCTVTLSDFKVTKSRYKEGGFTNDGKEYNFRFDTSVTGTIEADDMSYVKEWGYVYEDPEGKTAKIPLSGTKETVTRYAYFRNSAWDTARLYGYAYIEGTEQPVYYEVHDFSLIHNMAVANTGEYSNVTANSATVTCSFENVPEGASCGIEYSDGNNWTQQTVNNSSNEGSHTVNLFGLKPDTKYEYRAFIDDDGQMYYGSQLNFTTGFDLPDLSGTWHCTIYREDGSVGARFRFEFTPDHKVTHDGSDNLPAGEVGSWSLYEDGRVGVGFSWTGGSWSHPVWYSEQYSGQVNSLANPTAIEGTVYRAWAGGIGEHGNSYHFKMTR